MDNGQVPTSGEAAYELMPVGGNTGKCCSTDGYYRALNNTISFTTLAKLQINECDFSDSGTLNVSGLNQMWVTGCTASCTNPSNPINGSKSTLSIPISPAYTIAGTVSSNSQALSGQKVKVCDKTNDTAYVVTTGSTGNYRFLAKPDCSYKVSLCSDPGYYQCLSKSSTNSENGVKVNFNILPYTIDFTASGLPSGTLWSVELTDDSLSGSPSTTLSCSSGTIVFHVGNGSYSYTIEPESGFNIAPSSGSVKVSGSNQSVSVTFHWSISGNIQGIYSAFGCNMERYL